MGRDRMSMGGTAGAAPAKDQTALRMERMEAKRLERRRAMKEAKLERAEEEQRNIKQGNPGDVDFIGLVRQWREDNAGFTRPRGDPTSRSISWTQEHKICVCIRKRPLNEKEVKKKQHDAVTVFHPTATVHSAKLRVDGITKYLDHNSFCFDHAFDECSSTEDVYLHAAKPLVEVVCGGSGVRATVFAYGQTGSGKTHTMGGIQKMLAEDIFESLANNRNDGGGKCTLENTTCSVAIFELYGGRVQDLLNERNRLKVLEDGKGEVVVSGLEEFPADCAEDFLSLMESGQANRTTHATEANDVSSRSHAICQILLRDDKTNRLRGKLSLVDLAGSERGNDTASNNRLRRTESCEINTSLLALKECIRGLDSNSKHVPYRQSKLTLILKDCFTSKLAKTAMIATLSPGSFSTDHTVNTLRYADRIKEQKVADSSGRDNRTQRSPVRRGPIKTQPTKLPCRSQPLAKPRPPWNDGLDDLDELDMIMDGDDDSKSSSVDEPDEVIVDVDEPDEDIVDDDEPDEVTDEFNRTQQTLLKEEELLLNAHMFAITENAEMLMEEGKLLESVQCTEYDIDQYAARLGSLLDRKTVLVQDVQDKLTSFREQLKREEELSKIIGGLTR